MFDHIFYCALFIILILVELDKKVNPFGNDFHSFDMKIHKIYKKSQNLLKVLTKSVLFRNIALIFNSKKVLLENSVKGGVPQGIVKPTVFGAQQSLKHHLRNFRRYIR